MSSAALPLWLVGAWSPTWLQAAYLLTGLIAAIGYVPQILLGWRQPRATALAQSVTSWTLWTACRLVALAYCVVQVGDALLVIAVGLDAAGRLAVLLILLRARWLCTLRQSSTA